MPRSSSVKLRNAAIIFVFCLANAALRADWRDACGYTRLKTLAGAELPGAPTNGLTQVEAPELSGFCAPDTTNALFTGKTWSLKTGVAPISIHATHVATNYYATTSMIPGTTAVDVYRANDWVNSDFLKVGTSNSNPNTESRAVQNHSWVTETGWTQAQVEEANRRLDFAIDRDGFVCAVGSDNNGPSTTLPQFLCQPYHTISVGRDDGGHSAGFTAYDTTGRIKPDIVAPSADPEYATSYTTPMVAGAAGMLVAKLAAAPYSLTGADKPRVVKALLLATATKDTLPSWTNTGSRPLDLRYGAGILNTWLAYSTLRSGRAIASNTTRYPLRGWAAETLANGVSKPYYFNIPAGAPSVPFCSCVTWHRSVTKSGSNTWNYTMANLDLYLYQSNGFTPGNLVASSLSTVDNVELIYQPTLAPGNYVLVVKNNSSISTSYGLAWHSPPTVTVAATIPTAREIDGQTGLITFTRTGDTTLPLLVPLAIGGTAVAGSHYQALPAQITIAAGSATATVQVTPISDSIAQGDRTVTVAAAVDFGLVRDPAQAAVVTIQDKPFDAWRFANFTGTELGNSASSGESADPDGDQLPNLIEYALGFSPKSSNTLPATMENLGGYLAISIPKNSAATDITWNAETTGDLKSWIPATIVTNNSTTFEARDTVPKAAASSRFIRLKITRP